ncbi:MAG: hypothetical protein J1E06_05590 [Acutalibacter sp.]|nr:hypothetical protein [Acutalibacter sp.]
MLSIVQWTARNNDTGKSIRFHEKPSRICFISVSQGVANRAIPVIDTNLGGIDLTLCFAQREQGGLHLLLLTEPFKHKKARKLILSLRAFYVTLNRLILFDFQLSLSESAFF